MEAVLVKETLRSINIELRKQPNDRMKMFRIYIVMNNYNLPETLVGEWMMPCVDNHLTVAWIPPTPMRETLLVQTLLLSGMIWNCKVFQAPREAEGYMLAFVTGVALMNAVAQFETV